MNYVAGENRERGYKKRRKEEDSVKKRQLVRYGSSYCIASVGSCPGMIIVSLVTVAD